MVFGLPLSRLVALSSGGMPGDPHQPPEQRPVLWIMRHTPASSAEVLERARIRYEEFS